MKSFVESSLPVISFCSQNKIINEVPITGKTQSVSFPIKYEKTMKRIPIMGKKFFAS